MLEIWFRLSIFYKQNYDKEFSALFNEIKKIIPQFTPNEDVLSKLKNILTPLIFQLSIKTNLSDYDCILEKLEKSIELLAQENPIIAYKLNTARDIYKAQDYLDEYISEISKTDIIDDIVHEKSISNEQLATLHNTAKNHQLLEITKNIENNIVKLSFHLSIITLIQTIKLLRFRKKSINTVDDEQLAFMKKMAISFINELLKNHNLTKT